MPFPLAVRKLIRGAQAHVNAGLGIGADYVASINTPLSSSHVGTLYEPYWYKLGLGQGGRWVGIKRANGDQLEFAHLNGFLKKSGQTFPGEPLALTGNTGTVTTGPHLHVQIFDKNGKRLDPETYDWSADDAILPPEDPAMIEELKQQVRRLQTEVRKLTGEVHEANDRAERYKANIRDADRIIREQSTKIADMQGEIDRLKSGTAVDPELRKNAKEAKEHVGNAAAELTKASEKLPS